MKLSEVLSNYHVIALSSLVGFQLPEEDPGGEINIHFTEAGQEYEQYFLDQDIVLSEHMRGVFVVTDRQGNLCEFTALDVVDFKE